MLQQRALCALHALQLRGFVASKSQVEELPESLGMHALVVFLQMVEVACNLSEGVCVCLFRKHQQGLSGEEH